MAYFLKQGKAFSVTSKEALNLYETLPPGNYTVQKSMQGFYLEEIDSFVDIKKHYGDLDKNAERIYRTFADRPQSTGVMLNGQKGSGKSLLAKSLSLRGYTDHIPTIVINAAWRGDEFNKFIQSIDQPTILLFDEFEKVYSSEEQLDILTLLDGVYPSKKLFILTCNDKWRIDSNMRNRPGRIFYMIDFHGLDPLFVREYCEDNMKNKHHIQKTCDIASLFSEFNFDMLKALVEEMNRYNEDPVQALRILNIKPEYDSEKLYSCVLVINNTVVTLDQSEHKCNPLKAEVEMTYQHWPDKNKKGDDDFEWRFASFSSADLSKIDATRGVYLFKNKDNEVLTLTAVKVKEYNYLNSF